MARKRKIPPNPEMLKLLAAKKEADAKFEREMKAAEARRQVRLNEGGLLLEEAGALDWSGDELRAGLARMVQQRQALQKAA